MGMGAWGIGKHVSGEPIRALSETTQSRSKQKKKQSLKHRVPAQPALPCRQEVLLLFSGKQQEGEKERNAHGEFLSKNNFPNENISKTAHLLALLTLLTSPAACLKLPPRLKRPLLSPPRLSDVSEGDAIGSVIVLGERPGLPSLEAARTESGRLELGRRRTSLSR